MMEAVSASETSVNSYGTTRRSITENSQVHAGRFGNRKYGVMLPEH
jgi:hypothetical protein